MASSVRQPQMTERQLQGAVMNLAKLLGYKCYHTWLSTRSAPGFPDLVLLKDGQLWFIELKSATGKLSPHQEAWIEELYAVPGVLVEVWRPEHWLSGEIAGRLQQGQ
jgi:hypothetical protein